MQTAASAAVFFAAVQRRCLPRISYLETENAAAPQQSEVTHLALGQRGVSPRPSAHPGAPEITTIDNGCNSAGLRGRKYGLSCPDLLSLASLPSQPLRPAGRGLVGVGAGGDQGVQSRLPRFVPWHHSQLASRSRRMSYSAHHIPSSQPVGVLSQNSDGGLCRKTAAGSLCLTRAQNGQSLLSLLLQEQRYGRE